MEEHRQLRTWLGSMVEQERKEALRPMLADRIVRKAREQGLVGQKASRGAFDDMTFGILGWFRPVVAACLVVLIGLLLYNLRLTTDMPGIDSTADRLLGLPSVTVAVAYNPDFEDH
ncbi:MAG: hypothetical protein RIE53_04635 [Rhodothermales bacterium]